MGQSMILIFLIPSLLWFCYEFNFEHIKANNNKGIETSFLRGLDFHFLTTNFCCRELNLFSKGFEPIGYHFTMAANFIHLCLLHIFIVPFV